MFDFQKAKKEKEIITSFLESYQDKAKLESWKEKNENLKKRDEKKDTFWF